jgi:3-methyladenine DNA glycosylase Tag
MTRKDIILTADASGLSFYGMGKDREKFINYLERFAALVAAAEREKVEDLLKEYDMVNSAFANDFRARGDTK